MTAIFAPRPDECFIISEAEAFRSRDQITLKTDAAVYNVGTLVISEIVTGAKTGKYIRATQALADASTVEDYALVIYATDATAGDQIVAGFVRQGQVKSFELDLDVSLTIPEATALLAPQGIIVR